MKNKTKSLIKRIYCLVAVVCILCTLCLPCFATDSTTPNDDAIIDAQSISDESIIPWEYEFTIKSSIYAEPFVARGLVATTTMGLGYTDEGADIPNYYYNDTYYNLKRSNGYSREWLIQCLAYDVDTGITGLHKIDSASAVLRGQSFYLDIDTDSNQVFSMMAMFSSTPGVTIDYASHLEIYFSILGGNTVYYVESAPKKQGSYNYEDILELINSELDIDIPDGIIYIHEISCIADYVNSDTVGSTQVNDFNAIIDIVSYRFPITQTEYRALDIARGGSGGGTTPDIPDAEGIPDWLFLDYASWIGTAVSGFMNFEIVPYFSLGMVLSIILAFTLVMWWLKMFGGG